MKKIHYSLLTLTAGLFLAATTLSQAQTTIADWTFDNNGLGANSSPTASTGSGTASAIGLTTSLTTPPSISAPDIIANPETGSDSTPSTDDSWRIRGHGSSPNNGNGWTSAAGIGTQGTSFAVSTVGFDNIQISFDVAPTTQGEALLQVEYTTDGVSWNNATLSYAANSSLVLNNPASGGNTNIVTGSYLSMVGASQWYNGVTADLSGISSVNNDPNFAIEIVNAATGSANIAAAGTALNNTSGNWSIDNVDFVSGVTATPEPSTIALAGVGIAGLLALRRNRKN